MAIFRNGQTCSIAEVAATSVGGGKSSLCAAFDLADAGLKIFLVEHSPCPGRHVAQPGFLLSRHNGMLRRDASDHGCRCPQLSVFPAHIHHNQHLNIEIHTNPRMIGAEGQAGDLSVSPRQGQHQELRQCCTS